MNIGILFPRSNAWPLIGADFSEGLKTFIKQEGLDNEIHVFPESIGFGGSEKEVYTKAEKLLMMDDVDILLAFLDEKILELIRPLLLASGKLMIVVNPGANRPMNWVPQPNIVNLGLQHSLLTTMTGFAAGIHAVGVPAAMATTFYDCGYLHLAAMIKEFQSAKGDIRFNYINKDLYNQEFKIGQLTDFLKTEKNVQTLLCVFDSLPASLFYSRLNAYEDAHDLQLFVSPMMLEKKAMENTGEAFRFSITGYLPWHQSVPLESNRHFVDLYARQLKKEPNIFSLLGWEAGIVIQEIVNNSKGEYRNGEQVVEMLLTKSLDSPRGALYLDTATQFYLSPVIRCTKAAGSDRMEMEYGIGLENEWEEFSEKSFEGPASGWTNTYLCY